MISNQADWKRKTTEISLKQFISKPEKNDDMIIIFKVLECFCVFIAINKFDTGFIL